MSSSPIDLMFVPKDRIEEVQLLDTGSDLYPALVELLTKPVSEQKFYKLIVQNVEVDRVLKILAYMRYDIIDMHKTPTDSAALQWSILVPARARAFNLNPFIYDFTGLTGPITVYQGIMAALWLSKEQGYNACTVLTFPMAGSVSDYIKALGVCLQSGPSPRNKEEERCLPPWKYILSWGPA